MVLSPDWPPENVACVMNIEDLAVAILFELDAQDANSTLRNRANFINYVVDNEQEGWRPKQRVVTTQVYLPCRRDHLRALRTRVGAGLIPAPPTPPGVRVRTGRFA